MPEPPATEPPVRVELHDGPRDELRALFEEAEDSAAQLDAYMSDGEVLVAIAGDRVVGHLQLVHDPGDPACAEVKNMAVEPASRGRGIGALLVGAAVERARSTGRTTILVATAAADVGNLRFYQRAGFRMRSIERDAFTPATGYPPGILIDGIELRDRVWLDLEPGVRPPPS